MNASFLAEDMCQRGAGGGGVTGDGESTRAVAAYPRWVGLVTVAIAILSTLTLIATCAQLAILAHIASAVNWSAISTLIAEIASVDFGAIERFLSELRAEVCAIIAYIGASGVVGKLCVNSML